MNVGAPAMFSRVIICEFTFVNLLQTSCKFKIPPTFELFGSTFYSKVDQAGIIGGGFLWVYITVQFGRSFLPAITRACNCFPEFVFYDDCLRDKCKRAVTVWSFAVWHFLSCEEVNAFWVVALETQHTYTLIILILNVFQSWILNYT